MLISATEPAKITELDKWLKSNQKLKGTQLQDAAVKAGFDASFVALVLFPQVVAKMAEQIAWTTVLGQSFTADRSAVFASIQKLRRAGQERGDAEEHAAAGGRNQEDVDRPGRHRHRAHQSAGCVRPAIQHAGRVHAGANHGRHPGRRRRCRGSHGRWSDRIHRRHRHRCGDGQQLLLRSVRHGTVAATCTTTPGTTTTTIAKTPGKTGMDHREDIVEERSDRLEDRSEQRSDRVENTQEQRTDRQENRQENRPDSQGQRAQAQGTQAQRTERSTQAQSAATERATTQSATTRSATTQTRTGSPEARGYSTGTQSPTVQQRSGSSDAFSGYSNGQSQRASSTRGQQSRGSSSRSRGGGGGGGGRRR